MFASQVFIRLGERASDITLRNQVFKFAVTVKKNSKVTKKPVAEVAPRSDPTTFDDYDGFDDEDDNGISSSNCGESSGGGAGDGNNNVPTISYQSAEITQSQFVDW